jgi:hypothetical protein
MYLPYCKRKVVFCSQKVEKLGKQYEQTRASDVSHNCLTPHLYLACDVYDSIEKIKRQ